MTEPTFDPSKPFTVEGGAAPAAPTFDPSKPFTPAPTGPQVSGGQAALRGYLNGASAGFDDEVKGLSDASGLPDWLGGFRAPVGGARIGWQAIMGGDDALNAYKAGRDRIRELKKAAQAQHPGAYTAGDVGGAVVSTLAAPTIKVVEGAGMGGRALNAAVNAGAYGAAAGAGEGEGLADSVEKALTGGATGLAIGAAAAPAIEVLGSGASKLLTGLTSKGRNVEAAREVTEAIAKDNAGNPNAVKDAATVLEQANKGGVPLTVADTGGTVTRRLADSASIKSPVANKTFEDVFADRAGTQKDRLVDEVRSIIGGNPEAVGAKESIQQAAAVSNKANYARAISHPNAQSMWDEGFEQLTAAPAVQEAIKAATKTGANKAAAEGFRPPVNPFQFAADGTMTLKKDVSPSLQFWDHVKRNLDDKVSSLMRAGENDAAADVKRLRSALVGHLDELVPAYKEARAGAAAAFGAEDAMTAGEQFVMSTMGNEEARRALAKMTPEQKQAFAYGFASDFIKAVREVPDSADVTKRLNRLLNSEAGKERIAMAIGPDGGRRIEAFVRLENIMRGTKDAVSGNSRTAQRFVDAGLISGGLGYDLANGQFADPTSIGTMAVVGALTKAGRRQVNEKIAERVGQLLASKDPQALREALDMAVKNPRLMDAIRRADSYVAKILGNERPAAGLLAPAQGRADDQKQ
jgi:hypothetical protein